MDISDSDIIAFIFDFSIDFLWDILRVLCLRGELREETVEA